MNQSKKSPLADCTAKKNTHSFISQSSEEPAKYVISFSVVHGGDRSNCILPIAPYANFHTEAEAQIFRENALADFPNCRVAKQTYFPESPQDIEKISNELFQGDFSLVIKTNEFSPRAKPDSRLLMRRGIQAKNGDIVAVGSGFDLCRRVDLYRDDLEYFAVASCNQTHLNNEGMEA